MHKLSEERNSLPVAVTMQQLPSYPFMSTANKRQVFEKKLMQYTVKNESGWQNRQKYF